MVRHDRERGSIVIGWMTRLLVCFAVLGVVVFDGIAVAVANLGAADDAGTAASAAAYEYRESRDVQAAYNAAVASLPSDSESIPPKSFFVQPDGSIHLVVHRTARTLVMYRIGPLARYAVVDEQGAAPPPTS